MDNFNDLQGIYRRNHDSITETLILDPSASSPPKSPIVRDFFMPEIIETGCALGLLSRTSVF